MIVAKFGGTSVGAPAQIRTIANIVKKEIKKQPILVVSAVSGVTNLLLEIPSSSNKRRVIAQIRKKHTDLIKALFKPKERKEVSLFIEVELLEIEKKSKNPAMNKQDLDKLASFGEIMSSFLISSYLNKRGIKAAPVNTIGLIITDNNFGRADFLPSVTKKNLRKALLPLIKENIVPVVTGFVGSTKSGETTTLGRGGSDYTASIVGFCMGVLEIQIWTDVDGMFTADPRMIKGAKLLSTVSFKEASELAAFGARVLHPRSIRPAIHAGIPVFVLNTFKPNGKGTKILEKDIDRNPITAVSFKKHITLVNIYSSEMLLSKGFLANVFRLFAQSGISIDLVSVSEVSVSLTLDNDEGLDAAVEKLKKFSSVSISHNFSIVSLVGEGIVTSTKTIKRIFEILDGGKILVKMVSLGATDINVSIVIQYDQLEKAVRLLHNGLLLKYHKTKK
ncbi:MAG TPA: aspartate kinase [Candidatus Saccharimonadales bacterium]|nr:aspartate kinase [Candidatus Saccharimonadales bacterium]